MSDRIIELPQRRRERMKYLLETLGIVLICFCVLLLVFAGTKSIDDDFRDRCSNNGGLIVENTMGLYDSCIYPSDK